MSAQHTPGPWFWHLVRVQHEIHDEHGFPVAYTRAYASQQSEYCPADEANARLIAAAPELLAAVKTLRETLLSAVRHGLRDFPDAKPERHVDIVMADAVIAKATGISS